MRDAENRLCQPRLKLLEQTPAKFDPKRKLQLHSVDLILEVLLPNGHD